MKTIHKKTFLAALSLLFIFAVWTALICFVDVRPIGPNNSTVGFSTVNQAFHNLTGVLMPLYVITDWLGLIPVFVGFGFAILGLCQWIKRKNIWKVDRSILALGIFYVIVLGVYLLFEELVINYRPVLINGFLEASYPSSTTMLVLCIMPTAIIQLNARIRKSQWRHCISVLLWIFTAFMVIGRLLSGVHWLTDIVGGILLSAGLVGLYYAFNNENGSFRK